MRGVKSKYITVLLIAMILTFGLVHAQTINVTSFIKEQDTEELMAWQNYKEHAKELQKKQEENSEEEIEQVFFVLQGEKRFQGIDAKKRFPGYIEYATNYPKEAIRKGMEGTMVVKFTVNRRCEVEEVYILRGISPVINQEVIRVISSSPQWTPQHARGRVSNSIYIMSIDFRLKDKKNSVFIDGSPKIELEEFIKQNMEYPKEALENEIEGVVLVGFTVTKDGEVKDTHIIRGIDYFLNKEAVRVVNSFPKWNISTSSKKSKQETYVFPVPFEIIQDYEF